MLNTSNIQKLGATIMFVLSFTLLSNAQNSFPTNGNVQITGSDCNGSTGAVKIRSTLNGGSLFIDENELDTTSPYGIYLNNNNSHNVILANGGGKVGIGTASPAETLHLNGSIRGNKSGALRVSTGHGYLDIGPKSSSWMHFYTDRSKYYFDKEIRVNSGRIGSYDEDLSLRTSGTTRMRIDNSSGNILWGSHKAGLLTDQGGALRLGGSGDPYIDFFNNMTIEADIRLMLTGEDELSLKGGSLKLENQLYWGERGALSVDRGGSLELGGAGNAYIDFANENNSDTDFDIRLIQDGDNNLNLIGGSLNLDSQLYWGTNGALSVDKGGSLYLGGAGDAYINFSRNSSTASQILVQQIADNELTFSGNNLRVSVQGQLSAKEIKVTGNGRWADYVFEEDYDLNTLEEVEMHIEEKGHLPNVPDEATIATEGMDLGKLTIIQQEKIEELFLHLIKLNKKVEILVEENVELRKGLK